MDELRQVLELVRSRIVGLRDLPRLHEQNTKTSLIEPVLRALGWDVGNIEHVQLEFKGQRKDGPVDYALLLNRAPRMLVEAKALGEDLGHWVKHAIGYAGMAGVEWVLLTDGDEYRLYNSQAPVAADEKLFRKFRITNPGVAAEATLRMLAREALSENQIDALWRAYFVDQRVRHAIDALFQTGGHPSLVSLLRKQADGLSAAEVRASLMRARIAIDFPTPPPPDQFTPEAPEGGRVSMRDLVCAGLLRPGQELLKTYEGKELRAAVGEGGEIRFGDEVLDSPSAAGSLAIETVKGKHQKLKRWPVDGWSFWHYVDKSGERVPIGDLRKILIEKRGQGA